MEGRVYHKLMLTFKDIDKHSRIFQLCISVLSEWCPLSEPGPYKAGNSPGPDRKCRPHFKLHPYFSVASFELYCPILDKEYFIENMYIILSCLVLLNSVLFITCFDL